MGLFSSRRREFLKAVRAGDVAAVEAHLASGADPDATELITGDTAAIVAAEQGHGDVLRLLIAKGCNLGAYNPMGYTALTRAAIRGHVTVVESLLTNGADPNAVNKKGEPALISLLLAKEVRTPTPAHLQVIHALITGGADVGQRDNKGGTALLIAIRYGYSEVVQALLSAGADPHERLQGLEDVTPLWVAAALGHGDTVRALVERGADARACWDDGGTVLMVAAGYSQDRLSEFLRQGDDSTERVEAVKALIAAGAPVNAKTATEGFTALMAAAELGRVHVADALIEAGADLDARARYVLTHSHSFAPSYEVEYTGVTALMIAAVNSHLPVVRALISAGADLHATTEPVVRDGVTTEKALDALAFAKKNVSLASAKVAIAIEDAIKQRSLSQSS